MPRLATLAGLALVLSACDSGGPGPMAEPGPPAPTFSDLPDGVSLAGGFTEPDGPLVPAWATPPGAAPGRPGAAPRTAWLAGGALPPAASTYGCVLAAYDPRLPPEQPYRYRSVWLHFDDVPTGDAATFRYALRDPSTGRVTRAAVCRIPQTRGAGAEVGSLLGAVAAPPAGRSVRAPSPGGERRAARASASTAMGVLPGTWENDEGFVCPGGYDWGNLEMTWCVDGLGRTSLPVATVVADGPGGGGGGGGGVPGRDPSPDPWPSPDDPPGEGPPSDCISTGPGTPCLPGGSGPGGPSPSDPDPCSSASPPAYCTNKCETGDPVIDDTAVNKEFESLAEQSNHFTEDGSVVAQDERRETALAIYRDSNGQRSTLFLVPETSRPCSAALNIPFTHMGAQLEALVHYQPFSYGETLWTCAAEDRVRETGLPYETLVAFGQEAMSLGAKVYQNTPSTDDVAAVGDLSSATGRSVDGYIIDGDKIAKFDQDSKVIGDYVVPETVYGACAVTPRSANGLRIAGLHAD